MYVDGGLRQHAFSLKVMQATGRRPAMLLSSLSRAVGPLLLRPDSAAEPSARPIDLTLIANTDFVVTPQCVGNGFLRSPNARLALRSISCRLAAFTG